MNVIMHQNEDLELTQFDEPGLNIDQQDPEAHFSALQMFATAIGLCTYSVLAGYAENGDIATEHLAVRIRWSYTEHPYRIGQIDMDIHWPELPSSRMEAVQRAATKCTLHNTLEQPPKVNTKVRAKKV